MGKPNGKKTKTKQKNDPMSQEEGSKKKAKPCSKKQQQQRLTSTPTRPQMKQPNCVERKPTLVAQLESLGDD